MAWANVMLLGFGGLLITIPVILHFLMQPKPKKLLFPALRFVKKRQHSNRSRMRLRHLLLLLLRCLLIALLALALAGPSVASQEYGNWLTLGGIGFSALVVGIILVASLWVASKRNWIFISILSLLFLGHLAYGGWSAIKLMGSDSVQLIGDSQAPVAALVVLDTSPRMLYTHENKTRLERVKDLGDWLLSQFGKRIRAVAFGHAEEWMPEFEKLDEDATIDIAFRPVINEFRGFRKVEIQLTDWRLHQPGATSTSRVW